MPAFLARRADVVALIKPQFELAAERVGKGGIVREAEAREEARAAVLAAAAGLGFVVRGSCDSPIAGQDGNLEFLVWLGWERPGVPEDRSERSGS